MDKNFSTEVKTEVIKSVIETGATNVMSFLSAVVRSAGSLVISEGALKLQIVLEHAEARKCVCDLIRDIYGNSSAEAFSRDITLEADMADRLLSECGILSKGYSLRAGIEKKLISNEPSKIAYIRGAFIGCGSVSVKKGYHLEFSLSNNLLASDMIRLLSNFNIPAKTLARNDRVMLYIKGADCVSDALALLGASRAVLKLNSSFVDRQVAQLANRRSNCDLANIDKTVSAYERQRQAIQKLIDSGEFSSLDIRLQEAATARLNNPFISLGQLATLMNLSKSGLTHRLNKIILLSEQH